MTRRSIFERAAAVAAAGVVPVVKDVEPWGVRPIKTWAVWLRSSSMHVVADRAVVESELISFYLCGEVTGMALRDQTIHVEEIVKQDGNWFVTGNFLKLPTP